MRIGIVGCGSIGRVVARELDNGAVPGAYVAALCSRDLGKAKEFANVLSNPPVVPLEELVPLVDLVLETAGGPAVDRIAKAALSGGKNIMVLSSGALLGREDLQWPKSEGCPSTSLRERS